MSSCSSSTNISRKRGRHKKKAEEDAEANLIKRRRKDNGITKEIRIVLKKCDEDPELLNYIRNIDLSHLPSPPVLEVNGLVSSPSSSLASSSSLPPPTLLGIQKVNGIIKSKLQSRVKKEKCDLVDKAMAPGVEVSSPRSSRRRRQIGVSQPSNGAPEKGESSSPKKKQSRYPTRTRSTRSGSKSQDDTRVPCPDEVEDRSQSVESLAISKARKIKKKILESRLPSPPSSETPPPPADSDTGTSTPPIQVSQRRKRRRLPARYRSRSNSRDDIKTIQEDNEPLAPIPNGRHNGNEILESSTAHSPDHPSTSHNARLSSNGNEGQVNLGDKIQKSPQIATTVTTPPSPQVSPKRRRGRPPKPKPTPATSTSSSTTSPAIPGPSTRKRTREANIPVQPKPKSSPPKTNPLVEGDLDPDLDHPPKIEISEEVVNSSVIVTISTPSRPAPEHDSDSDSTVTSPPSPPPSPLELVGRRPSQVICIRTPTPSPCKEPVSPSRSSGNSCDRSNVPLTNGPLLGSNEEDGSDDSLEDLLEPIHFKTKPVPVKPNELSSQRETNNSLCVQPPPPSPQPSSSSAPNEKGVLDSAEDSDVAETEANPRSFPHLPTSSNPPSQNDDQLGLSSEEDDDSSSPLEIPGVGTLAKNKFLLSTFSSSPATIAYYCCVMWDVKILNDLRYHEESRHQLYVANSIGKMISESLKNEGHSFPGVAQMDWKRKFILLDIITADFSKCGILTSLRVQEKASIDTLQQPSNRPPIWDLVIHPQCINIAKEMVRLFRSGVKTTVVIWGAHVSNYSKLWNGTVKGEILLAPTKMDSEVLSVIIFHHEILSHERFRLIQEDAHPGGRSELWPNFQDPQLNHRLFMQAELVHRENPTHFTLHAEKLRNPKDYKKATENKVNIVEGVEVQVEGEEEEECEEVNEFPEVDSGEDEDDFGMVEDEQFSDGDEWDNLDSASCMDISMGSSPEVQASVSQDMVDLAARIFRRSSSVPAELISPSPRRIERRTSEADNVEGDGGRRASEGDKGGAGAGAKGSSRAGSVVESESSKGRVVSDSQKKFLLTQELVVSDDEENQVDGGGNELEQTVLTCEDDFVTGDEGSSPLPKSPAGTKKKKSGSGDQTNLCNGHGPGPSTSSGKKRNSTEKEKGTSKVTSKSASVNGKGQPPPSNSEHSEYNFTALLDEF